MPRPQQPRGEVSGTGELASGGDRQDNAKPQPDWPVEDADRSPASSEATPPQPSDGAAEDGSDATAPQQKTASAAEPDTERQDASQEAEQRDADQDQSSEQGGQAAESDSDESGSEEQRDQVEAGADRSSAQRSDAGAAPSTDADDAGGPAEQASEEDRSEEGAEPSDAQQQSAETGASSTAEPSDTDTAEQEEAEPAEESGASDAEPGTAEATGDREAEPQPAAGEEADSGAPENSTGPAEQPDSDTERPAAEQREEADTGAAQRSSSAAEGKTAEPEEAESAEQAEKGAPEKAGEQGEDAEQAEAEPAGAEEEPEESADSGEAESPAPEQDGEAPRQDDGTDQSQQSATEQPESEERSEPGGEAGAGSNALAKSQDSPEQPTAADGAGTSEESGGGAEPERAPEEDSSARPEAGAPEESTDEPAAGADEEKGESARSDETADDQEPEQQDAASPAAEDSPAEDQRTTSPEQESASTEQQREEERTDEQPAVAAKSTSTDQQTDRSAETAEQSSGEPAEQADTRSSAADDGETTQVIPRVVVTEPQAGEQPTAGREAPPATDAEQTQQLAPVTAPEETDSERTARIDLRELQDTAPSGFRAPAVPPNGGGRPRGNPQQMTTGAPRPASPEDFAGVLRGQPAPPPAKPAQPAPPAAPPSKPRQPSVFAGQQTPEPQIPARLRRRRGLVLAAVALVAVLVVGVAVAPGLVRQALIADPPAPVQLEPSIKPLSADAPAPGPNALSAALTDELANPALGQLGGIVLDPVTDEVLWQQNADQALVPGSTGKLLTAGAVLLSLDHQKRFTTKVVRGSTPGSIVIVGGGDPTLTTLPEGQESVYPGAARLDDLVQQLKQSVGDSVVSVQVDTSRYAGPKSAPGWLPQDVPAGYIAPIEPVMLDGARQDPQLDTSPRSQTPALDVAKRVAAAFGTTQVSEGEAPQNAEVLAEVQSPTVRELTEVMLQRSDNVLAETLAREVAIANGNAPTFEGATKAIRQVLQRHGIELGQTSMVDGSGLSLDDRMSSKVLGNLLSVATEPASPEGGLSEESAKLRALLLGLPVAGGTGSLAGRFTDEPGKGWVRAKTGTLEGANSLAGMLVTADGRLLVFALISNGTSRDASRAALDDLVSAIQQCGCR